jgi:hypothetical protein
MLLPGLEHTLPFSRRRIDLDGTWRFVPDPPEELCADGQFAVGMPMAVPSCWEATIGPTTPLATGWFIRSFEVPLDWDGGRSIFRFGAVSYRADVWLNGVHLGSHAGAYTAFELTADGAIRPGMNELLVRVVNPAGAISAYPTFDSRGLEAIEGSSSTDPIREIPIGKQTWYSSLSGIWQDVELELRPSGGLGSVSVLPDLAAELVAIEWTREAPGGPPGAGDELRLTVVDSDGTVVARVTHPDPGKAGAVSIELPGPRPWDLDDPHLYRLEAELCQEGTVIDRIEVRFGMRTIGVADGRVALNGRPLYVRGVLDQDVFDGTLWLPPSRSALESQFRRVKAMGLNVVRCHVKVPDPMYFEIADEIGLLVWAELPSWNRLTEASRDEAKRTLGEMVEQLRHHPSVAIWTIVNENWGTDLIRDGEHRSWLRETYDWLKALDPTRLVVDNSACWTPDGGNFHLATDIADYHVYFGMPDHADRWQAAIGAFAERPRWLWSRHGDAAPGGGEPLILSEFGNWGLPRFSYHVDGAQARDKTIAPVAGRNDLAARWWTATGDGAARPDGANGRFAAQGLARIASDVDSLADATQWHQFDAMQYEVGQLRRHPSIAGYVVTELSDAFWEANGLVNLDRSEKVFGDRLVDIFGADTLFANVERWDIWSGSVIRADLHAQFGDPVGGDELSVAWRLSGPDFDAIDGSVSLSTAPGRGAASGRLAITPPAVDRVTTADLDLELLRSADAPIVRQRYRLILAPESARSSHRPADLTPAPGLVGTPLGDRIAAIGHTFETNAETLVTNRLDDAAVAFAERGGHVLAVLDATDVGFPWVTEPASTRDLGTSSGLARNVSIQSRYGARDPSTSEPMSLEGDWVSSFAWIDPSAFPTLPARTLLDFAYRDVLPDLVMLGADEAARATEVVAGCFVGWVAQPAAYAWRFTQGSGQITATTLRLGSDGPVAHIMLESLIQLSLKPSRATA